MFMKQTSLIGALMLFGFTNTAYSDERYQPINDPVVKQECGDCHMPFQPQMLPQRSWGKIMDDLSNHFGEDASLDGETTQHIRQYLVKNAADSDWWSGKFMRGIDDKQTPIRITETPYWVREHNEEVRPSAWSDPKIKSKANCIACHTHANKGYYDDD